MSEADFIVLPGGDLVADGLSDLSNGQCSENALLVLIASPRLRTLGIDVPELHNVAMPYEHRLYERLEHQYGAGAHSRYNALIRRIVSFAHALDRIQWDELRSTTTG